jgi:hypothetical protein
MLNLLVDIWAFLTGKREHPLVRHEERGWAYVGVWRKLHKGCLPLVALALGGASCGCGLLTLSNIAMPDELFLVPGAALIGLLIAGELIRWLTGLLATVLAATTISAEIEADTYGLLRLTPLTAREIVLAKLGAAFRQFRVPLIATTLARAAFVVGMALWVGALLLVESTGTGPPSGVSGTPIPLPAGEVAGLILPGLAVLAAALIWLVYYLAGPALGVLMYATLGMLASAWSRSRSGGVVLAFGLRVALWMASYVGGQLVSISLSLLTVPLFALSTTPAWLDRLLSGPPGPAMLLLSMLAVGWVAFLTALRIGIVLLVVAVTIRRAGQLPDPGASRAPAAPQPG